MFTRLRYTILLAVMARFEFLTERKAGETGLASCRFAAQNSAITTGKAPKRLAPFWRRIRLHLAKYLQFQSVELLLKKALAHY